MLSQHDRIKLLEREQERLEENVEFLIDELQKLKDLDCPCGGQSCDGPIYKPETVPTQGQIDHLTAERRMAWLASDKTTKEDK